MDMKPPPRPRENFQIMSIAPVDVRRVPAYHPLAHHHALFQSLDYSCLNRSSDPEQQRSFSGKFGVEPYFAGLHGFAVVEVGSHQKLDPTARTLM
ncbi:hypothetical protein IFR05_010404, partial [Cadophora sp. M221]